MSTRLERQSLAELLRAIHEGKQDARVYVEHDGEQSQLWCQCGDVVDARSARLAGGAAIYRMLSLESGRYTVRFGPIERARTVEASTPALLIEAARRLDECRQLRQLIGDTSAIFVASANAYAAEGQLSPNTWQVLRAFDGVSSVERVVHHSSLPDLETLRIISELLEQAWVIPKPAPTAPQWLPLGSRASQRPELSFVPLAQSLRARFSQHVLPRRAWIGAAVGSALTVGGFAVGVWLARDTHPSGHAAAAGGDWNATPPGTCPAGLALVVGGQLPGVAEDVKEQGSEPARPVDARSFCMSQDEVTVGEYTTCVSAGACEPAQRDGGVRPAKLATASRKNAAAAAEVPQCNFGQAGRDLYPINCVSFQQAQQYCAWRGGRLPTQTEWEFVAERASSDSGEQHPGTVPVGSFPAAVTPEGILDLLGNVSEWTSGHVDFHQRGADGSEGVHHELYAVLGGSLEPGASRIGSQISRMYMNASARGRNVGFRCAFDD